MIKQDSVTKKKGVKSATKFQRQFEEVCCGIQLDSSVNKRENES